MATRDGGRPRAYRSPRLTGGTDGTILEAVIERARPHIAVREADTTSEHHFPADADHS